MKIYKTNQGYIGIYKKGDGYNYKTEAYATRREVIAEVLNELSLLKAGFLNI